MFASKYQRRFGTAEKNTAPAEGNPPPPAGPNVIAASLPIVSEGAVGGDFGIEAKDAGLPAAESIANGTTTAPVSAAAGDAKDHHAAGDGGEDAPPPADGEAATDAPGDGAAGEPDNGEKEEQGASESSDGEEKEEVWVSAEV